ncbi:DUF6308 family protein [Arthrobacter sp. NPDC056727]|uniref:DUF6308 family protein n=1 Tax=Arthrobacter sp. NPDC056727 TaxID=3345927 RepID=UPI00366C2D9D
MTLTQRIDEVITSPAHHLLADFFDPEGPFAGSTFDELGENPPQNIGPADLVAVSLLDVRFEPRAVRAILQTDSSYLSKLLIAIPADVDIWDAEDRHLDAAAELFSALDAYAGVGETKASKLLARKRPRLLPVIDSVVRKGLPLGSEPARELRDALSDPSRRTALEALRPRGVSPRISTIRLLDAAVWMRYSQSRNAKRARRRAGV